MATEVFEGLLIDYYGSPEVMNDEGKHEGLQPCLRRLHRKRVRIRVDVCCEDATPGSLPEAANCTPSEGVASDELDEALGMVETALDQPGVATFSWATQFLSGEQREALAVAGVVTFGGLREKTDAELEALPGIGRVTVEKLRAAARGKSARAMQNRPQEDAVVSAG